ncbi:hypothetical protein Acr_00g0024420 [Actinidia rufa]|uniref:Uncharacterized protein n=1 Tax=Actinidia rufa TaxID=165716 RepID=A0A7J0DEE9_9ERIC|nr:hypothetical protein Acr_00g0024420 [Actinidia rufa]
MGARLKGCGLTSVSWGWGPARGSSSKGGTKGYWGDGQGKPRHVSHHLPLMCLGIPVDRCVSTELRRIDLAELSIERQPDNGACPTLPRSCELDANISWCGEARMIELINAGKLGREYRSVSPTLGNAWQEVAVIRLPHVNSRLARREKLVQEPKHPKESTPLTCCHPTATADPMLNADFNAIPTFRYLSCLPTNFRLREEAKGQSTSSSNNSNSFDLSGTKEEKEEEEEVEQGVGIAIPDNLPTMDHVLISSNDEGPADPELSRVHLALGDEVDHSYVGGEGEDSNSKVNMPHKVKNLMDTAFAIEILIVVLALVPAVLDPTLTSTPIEPSLHSSSHPQKDKGKGLEVDPYRKCKLWEEESSTSDVPWNHCRSLHLDRAPAQSPHRACYRTTIQ